VLPLNHAHDRDGERRLLDDFLRGDHKMIFGFAILGEFESVLVDTCGWASDRAAAVRAEFESIAEVVTPLEVPSVCRDPDDDRVLLRSGQTRARLRGSLAKRRLINSRSTPSGSYVPAHRVRSRWSGWLGSRSASSNCL
jgi:hypothetical protein